MATNKRISLSQLSEYLTAGPSRRKSIIADAADPKPFIAQTYNAAASAISSDIGAFGNGSTNITSALDKLQAKLKQPIPDWQKQHVLLCIEALKKYQLMRPKLKLETATILPASVGPGHIMIGGMRVNVSPEAILQREDGNELRVGGIKFYFSKSKKLGKERADYFGAAMDWYCEKQLKKQGLADYRCSLLVDLPGGVVHAAPRAKIRNRNNLQAACEEITALWPG